MAEDKTKKTKGNPDELPKTETEVKLPPPPLPAAAVDDIKAKLSEFGPIEDSVVDAIKNVLGATTVENLALLTESDLTGVGMKPIPARSLVNSLKNSVAPVVATPTVITPQAFNSFNNGILATVPDDNSFLESLRTGGILKVDYSTVISAIRSTLADKVGMFKIPAKLVEAMDKYAEENDEAADPTYFKISNQLTRHSYADIFSAIEGLNANFVTKAKSDKLLAKIDNTFWPSVIDFYNQLKSWQEAWMQGVSNPANFMSAMMANSNGMPLPPGMMSAPDTGVLHDYADALNDAINKVFSGVGIYVSAALSSDALQIKKTLEDPRLPSLIGVANREQMLKKIGTEVSSTYTRLETNLTQFVLSVIQFKDKSADEELTYLSALCMLGSQIPWDSLVVGNTTGLSRIGGKL